MAEGRQIKKPKLSASAGAISATDDVSGGAGAGTGTGTGTLIKWSAYEYSTIVTKGN